MLTFLNFNSLQLAATDGFNRKIKRVASFLEIERVLYSEIINIEDSSIDVLLVDDKMYFYKVHLYSQEAVKMLNEELSETLIPLGYTIDIISLLIQTKGISSNEIIIELVYPLLSKSMELLNVENSYNIDKLDKSVSSEFNVSIENFSYDEVHKAVEPFVKDFINHLYNFKIISLSKTSIEVLAITTECRLYQYTIPLSKAYTKFFNRYLSAILPYESFVPMKRNLKKFDFTQAIKETLPIYNSKKEKLNTCGFLTFLLKQYKSDIKEEGAGVEGLKNFYKFFLDTSSDEEEANAKIRECFMKAKTYEQKSTR